jgi:hypothetical protein
MFSARSNLCNILNIKLLPRKFLLLVDVKYLELSRKPGLNLLSWSLLIKKCFFLLIFAQKQTFDWISRSSKLSPVPLKVNLLLAELARSAILASGKYGHVYLQLAFQCYYSSLGDGLGTWIPCKRAKFYRRIFSMACQLRTTTNFRVTFEMLQMSQVVNFDQIHIFYQGDLAPQWCLQNK